MKKITSLLLCMVLVLSMFCVNAAAAENACMEAGVTVADDGIVTVVVTALQPAANARLTVDFDSDYLTYVNCETPFAVHSVKAEAEKLTIGLANATADAVPAGGELVKLCFAMTGRWDETVIGITCGGETVTVTAQGSGYRFQDVSADEWFYEAVERMAAEGHIKGISEDHFGPALEMNRASFVTLLGRLEGVAETKAETPFADVPVNSFYSGYVAWAVEKKITNGIDATHFAPAASINRAQMVTFLYRYAQSKGMDVSVEDPAQVLEAYTDGEAVAAIDWAAEPFAWAVSNGIISGMEGALNPNGTANRAQVAVMLYRFFYEN